MSFVAVVSVCLRAVPVPSSSCPSGLFSLTLSSMDVLIGGIVSFVPVISSALEPFFLENMLVVRINRSPWEWKISILCDGYITPLPSGGLMM